MGNSFADYCNDAAYPVVTNDSIESEIAYKGITKLEYFTAQMLKALPPNVDMEGTTRKIHMEHIVFSAEDLLYTLWKFTRKGE